MRLDWEKAQGRDQMRTAKQRKFVGSVSKRMTEKQRNYLKGLLKRQGLEWKAQWDSSLSKSEASYLINELSLNGPKTRQIDK